MSSNTYLVTGLLEKMDSHDTDYRYMALNDLTNEIQKDDFRLDEAMEKKVVAKVLVLMNDANGEVQNLAVKCLAPFVKKIREAQLQEIADKLCEYRAHGKEELRDIAGIGLKTVIVELPANSPIVQSLLYRLIPNLLTQLESNSTAYEVKMDTLDILSEILARFGHVVGTNPPLQKRIQNVLVPLLAHSRPAFRKRTTVALGNLVAHTSDELFDELVARLLPEFNRSATQRDSRDRLKTLIQCAGTLSRTSARRLGKHLSAFLPYVVRNVEADDDELREICLQALESFVLRCPTEMTPHVNDIIQLCLNYLKHDPNYAEDDEDVESEDDQDEEMQYEQDEEDDEEDEGEYSDDDDLSWKVRRSSAKVLAAIIGTRHELLSKLYEQVAPALVRRFSEREESVRVEIFQTFIVLLKQTQVYGGDDGSKQQLRMLIPKLSRNLSKQLLSKSIATKQTGFSLLRELVTVLNGGLENQIKRFIPAIESSLAASADSAHHHFSTNSNLKIETLMFLRQLFKVHPAYVFHNHLARLCPPITRAGKDAFYKIASEALLVCIELVKIIRPVEIDASTQAYNVQPINSIFQPYVQEIYSMTAARLSTTDDDQEVKERSIMCLGVLLSETGDTLSQKDLQASIVMLTGFLGNEVTRLTTVKTFASVADSPVCTQPLVRDVVLRSVSTVTSFLRKTHRQLKVSSLLCLEVFNRKYGEHFGQTQCADLVAQLTPHISDQDLHLLPLALNTLVSLLVANPDSIQHVYQQTLPSIFEVAQSKLTQGAALTSLLKLFQTLIKANERDFANLQNGLLNPIFVQDTSGSPVSTVSAQAYSTVAQCITVMCVGSRGRVDTTVTDFANKARDEKSSDAIKHLSLVTIGEIGCRVDLSNHQNLHETILDLFSSPSEEVKSAAAFSLGNVAAGNVQKYLPIVINEIHKDPRKRYLLLHAVKEIIARHSHEEGVKALSLYADNIWNILFESGGITEEGTRNVVAECLGKLTVANPQRFLSELQKRLQSDSPQTRGTVVTAFKYTFTGEGRNYDELLRPLVVDFLSLMRDQDLNVRRLSLSTLNSAAHNKPYLIRDVLDQLLPLLYEETLVKEHLIRMVEMGPFKHKVDDGLDLRKSAYECMQTLLDTCLDKLDIFRFLDRVLAGLTDQHDITILSYTMLIRLAHVAPTAVTQKLDDTADPLKATLTSKLKENAVKSEIERNSELQRSAIRVLVHLEHLAEQGGSPKFDSFLKEARTSMFPDVYKSVQAEVENKEYL